MDIETTQAGISFEPAGVQPEEPLGGGATAHGAETPTTVSDDAMVEDTSPTEAAAHARDEEQHSLNTAVDSMQHQQPQPQEASVEATKTRSSQYRGVCWNKKNKRWQAAINNGGRYIYLGSFTSDKDAARAFDLAALQIRGRNTKLNFSVDSYPEEEWKNGAPPHLAEKYMSGTARPKPAPFRPFTGTPLKKLHPSQFAAIQVPFKRPRYEEAGFGKRAFDRAEQRFLSGAFFTTAMNNNQPKIKQEFPSQTPTVVDHSFNKVGSQSMHFDKSSFFLLSNRFDSSGGLQPNRTISVPSITTPPFHQRVKDPFDQARDFGRGEAPFPRPVTSSAAMEDSAEQKVGMTPVPVLSPIPGPYRFHSLQSAAAMPLAGTSNRAASALSDRLPVPILQSSTDEHSLHVSSVISETVAGSDIAEAKVIVGSSRNQFGLIHRTVNDSKWTALVWDGSTMHNMGVYASEDDSQVACSSAVRLVEAIMGKNIQ